MLCGVMIVVLVVAWLAVVEYAFERLIPRTRKNW